MISSVDNSTFCFHPIILKKGCFLPVAILINKLYNRYLVFAHVFDVQEWYGFINSNCLLCIVCMTSGQHNKVKITNIAYLH